MDIEQYISSGIIEGYVLGTISEQERQEVECMAKIYPEIKTELIRTQSVWEQFALAHPKSPRPSLKKKILEKISDTSPSNTINLISFEERKKKIVLVISLVSAAAIFMLLIGYFYLIVRDRDQQISDLKLAVEKSNEDYTTLESNIIALNDINVNMGHEIDMFRNPAFKTVFLEEMKDKKGSLGIICWNRLDHKVMIAMENIPEMPNDKSMQLWAIVDGKPMSLGVLPEDLNAGFRILDTTVENPSAFAITLENRGGSITPTLDQMIMAGNL